MSHYPFDRSFHSGMSECLLRLASNFKIDNRIVSWDELISSDTLLNEVAHALARKGWPARTYEEIRKELLRLNERWKKKGQHVRGGGGVKHPFLWIDDSEDEDDIFMPSTKSASSTKAKSASSTKAKSSASSKGESSASSKDDDDFM